MKNDNKEILCISLAIVISLAGLYMANKIMIASSREGINFRELFLFDVVEKAFKKGKEQD